MKKRKLNVDRMRRYRVRSTPDLFEKTYKYAREYQINEIDLISERDVRDWERKVDIKHGQKTKKLIETFYNPFDDSVTVVARVVSRV